MLRVIATIVLVSFTQGAGSEWQLSGVEDGYVMNATGNARDSSGATILLSSDTAIFPASGRASAKVVANEFRLRRIAFSGEIQTRGAVNGASLWLRVDRSSGRSLFDLGFDQRLQGDVAWTERSMSMPVPADATAIQFGLTLRGRGTVSAPNVRLTVGEILRPDGPIAPRASEVLEAAIETVARHALRRANITEDIERAVRTLASGAKTPNEVNPAIQYLLGALADNHSGLMSAAQWEVYRSTGAANPRPEVNLIDGRTGYVSLPGYDGDDLEPMRAYVRDVHALLSTTMPGVRCGWIVDLRRNSGGNTFPMLAALKPFLGEVSLGRNMGPDGLLPPRIAGELVGVEPSPALTALADAFVAVLTGSRTNSAGEFVAISFRGRPRTRSFGGSTAGRTTANRAFTLPDGTVMALAISVAADRTGRIYGGKVDPDEILSSSDEAMSPDRRDATVTRAAQWLAEMSNCAP
jgi:carboxyl-terminal processing protease